MATREILLLGNPRLYQASEPIRAQELESLPAVMGDLHDTLMDFRRRHGAGRAIAAPQIGVRRRLLYMCLNEKSTVFINPRLEDRSETMMTVWDDCMSFPDLLVKVRRHQACRIRYRDLDWQERVLDLEGDLSELLQHEYDHLDGVLAVSRAVDGRSFVLKSQKHLLNAG
jgi:peptide deformylase